MPTNKLVLTGEQEVDLVNIKNINIRILIYG